MPHQLTHAKIRRNACALLGTALLAVAAPAAASAAATTSHRTKVAATSGLHARSVKSATTLPNGLVLRILPYSRD